MRATVVFESLFGNTERVARTVGETLGAAGADTSVVDVRKATHEHLRGRDLVVVGAPTHALSLSRPSTRNDAVRQGAPADRASRGVREWLADLEQALPPDAERPRVAVFDTRVTAVRHLPGSAARRIARVLRARGFVLLGSPTSFYVTDLPGPLADGEEQRVREWAEGIVGLLPAGTG